MLFSAAALPEKCQEVFASVKDYKEQAAAIVKRLYNHTRSTTYLQDAVDQWNHKDNTLDMNYAIICFLLARLKGDMKKDLYDIQLLEKALSMEHKFLFMDLQRACFEKLAIAYQVSG